MKVLEKKSLILLIKDKFVVALFLYLYLTTDYYFITTTALTYN